MSCLFRAGLCAFLAFGGTSARADDQALVYPETRKVDVAEVQFGERVADPYRWLENDVRVDPEVEQWVNRQNAAARSYLDGLPQREWFVRRIRSLMDYERFGLPQKAGANYFYTRNSGLQNQSQLFVRKGLSGAPRLLIDPNAWASDGATALAGWEPSDNGKLLAYSVQDGGSDWRTIRILDVRTGKVLADEVKWSKFSGIAWIGNKGFLYSRFPEPKAGQEFQQPNKDQAVFFHRVGTPQSADQPVYATPDRPEFGHGAQVTHDGRWLLITTSHGTDNKHELHLMRLSKGRWAKAEPLVKGLEHNWQLIDGIGDRLYFITNKGAPRLKVVKVDLSRGVAGAAFEEVVAERKETLENAKIIGNRLILSHLLDAASIATVLSLDGRPVREIALNSIGTAAGFAGKPGDPETFYAFTSFNQPSVIYRFDSATGQSTEFATPNLAFDPEDYTLEQRFFASKDGTRVPMFLVRKKSVAEAGKPVPTLLYGYGGFDAAQTPSFVAARMAWLEAGGAFALANIRGGGEFGKAWHDAGRLANKQNVFDDFIAAGEYLIAQGITSKGGLAIQGRSNGGLLIGAVLNQRPDLFAAANPAVGVMDMLRFDRFTAGRYWVDDYGHPDKEGDWRVLRDYSPYHNIRRGIAYPAVLVTTADTDDRVVPGHSFKYTAALQEAGLGPRPQLIRIDSRSGHGSGKPTDKVVEEYADILAFFAHWTGLKVE
jgi:prolyl oligopeptidase